MTARTSAAVAEANASMHLTHLFQRVGDGDVAAVGTLYDLLAPTIYGVALWRTGSKDDAEDVVHDVFIRLSTHGPALARIRDPRAWLITVTHRRSIDIVRRRTRRSSLPLQDCPFLEADDSADDRNLDAARISNLLARLPASQREAIYLRYYEELTFSEIARVTGVPTFTAASRYRLGMRRLRILTGEEHGVQ